MGIKVTQSGERTRQSESTRRQFRRRFVSSTPIRPATISRSSSGNKASALRIVVTCGDVKHPVSGHRFTSSKKSRNCMMSGKLLQGMQTGQRALPHSKFEMVSTDLPSMAASCALVRSRASRKARIRCPIFQLIGITTVPEYVHT